MNRKTLLAETERVPNGFVAICPADHPSKPGTSGMLARNRNTGVYALIVNGVLLSVPHRWAANLAAGLGMGPDAIQDQLIARMEALALNPNKVAELVDGQVSRSHVCDYLTRRASIGSHKLQHMLNALKMELVAKE